MILLLALLTLVSSTTLMISIDNSSLLTPYPFINDSYVGPYISFKDDCYPGSMRTKPNKILIKVYPSMPLLAQFGNKKKLISHVNQLITESNKIFINQLNIKLIPSVVIPKITHPEPINRGINVLGDLNSFGVFLRGSPYVPINLFLANNYNGIVGAAYIGTLGSKNFNYGVSVNRDSVISHEILHMFGAQHTFGKGGVMSYTDRFINGVLQMHPDNKNQVCGTLNYYFSRV